MIRYARNAFATAISKPSRYISIDININVNITRNVDIESYRCKYACIAVNLDVNVHANVYVFGTYRWTKRCETFLSKTQMN